MSECWNAFPSGNVQWPRGSDNRGLVRLGTRARLYEKYSFKESGVEGSETQIQVCTEIYLVNMWLKKLGIEHGAIVNEKLSGFKA